MGTLGDPKVQVSPQVVSPSLGASFSKPWFSHFSQDGCTRTDWGGSWQPLLCKQLEVQGVPWVLVLFQTICVKEPVKSEDQRPGGHRAPCPLPSWCGLPVPWLPSFWRCRTYSQPRSVVSLCNIYSCDRGSEDHRTSVIRSISVRAE